MDINLSAIGGLAGSLSLLIIIIEKAYNFCNHKRVISKCCGKVANMSIDVENTTPNITPPQERAFL